MHGIDVNLILHIIDGAIALVGLYFGHKNRNDLKDSKKAIEQNAKDIDGVAVAAGTERALDRVKRESGEKT